MTAWECYRRMAWTSDRDECEAACGRTMGPDAYIEGALGHYCSPACRDESEDFPATDDRAAERRQMGIID
jgi:hypothetical protein